MSTLRGQITPTGLPFQKFVVRDVISTTSIFADQDFAEANMNILVSESATEFADTANVGGDLHVSVKAPRNSLLVSPFPSTETNSIILLIPFFSSHICLPVKPGEIVWGMISERGKGYWLSRVHELDHVEDVNYTHSDRSAIPTLQNCIETPESIGKEINHIPGFPNGTVFGNRESDLFKDEVDINVITSMGIENKDFSFGMIDEYENVVRFNSSTGSIVYEPVPRLTKRPGDFAIQGSNNTSITLGTERGYGKVKRPTPLKTNMYPPEDQSAEELTEGMGAIDIVAGRGRIHGDISAIVGSDPIDTRPRVIQNTREKNETHKNLGLEKGKAPFGVADKDVPEGDPDLVHDASRLYLSMKSSPDSNFGLEYPTLNGEQTVAASENQATVALKSDQIRIIARKDENNNINGAVRIIKEGTEDTDRAVIVMEPDGTIMIDGPRIIIGSGIESANGEGTQTFIGRDASEPIVLGDILLRKLVALETAFNNHIHNGGTGPVGPHFLAAGGRLSQEFANPPASAVEAVQAAQAAQAAEGQESPQPNNAGNQASEPDSPAPTASASGRTILSKVGKTK